MTRKRSRREVERAVDEIDDGDEVEWVPPQWRADDIDSVDDEPDGADGSGGVDAVDDLEPGEYWWLREAAKDDGCAP